MKYVKELEKIIFKFKPDLIFTHSYSDLNIDHKITNNAVITATRPIGKFVKTILFFEIPSSTEGILQMIKNISGLICIVI